jgi:hypothetical protein
LAIYKVMGSMVESQQAPAGEGDEQWSEVVARYDVLQAAATFAWQALLDANKPSPAGSIDPQPELLLRYRNLSAMRMAAEQAMLAYSASREAGPPK